MVEASLSREALEESERLLAAARAALAHSEARWRRELGQATGERNRLRAEIGALRRSEGGSPAPKRARRDEATRDAAATPDAAATRDAAATSAPAARALLAPDAEPLSRTELYAMYAQSESALREERSRAAQTDGLLNKLMKQLQARLPQLIDKTTSAAALRESNAVRCLAPRQNPPPPPHTPIHTTLPCPRSLTRNPFPSRPLKCP